MAIIIFKTKVNQHMMLFMFYDLVSRIILSGSYLLYYLMYESQIWCFDSSWDGGVVNIILIRVTLIRIYIVYDLDKD